MSTPDSADDRAPAGSRWSTRRWLVVGLVVLVLVVWLALRFAFFTERENQYFGTLRASIDKTLAEMQRQAALPADRRSPEQLATVVGLDITDERSNDLLRIAVPASDLSGATQYAVVTATSWTPDLAVVLGVEGRYTELLVAGTYTGTTSDQLVCALREDSPDKGRIRDPIGWGPLTIEPCTDEQVAAAGGIAR
jgi:hypothetical protein